MVPPCRVVVAGLAAAVLACATTAPPPRLDGAAAARRASIAGAIDRGVDYLGKVQAADGWLPLCWVATAPRCRVEETPFVGALVAAALEEIPDERARRIRARVRAHLDAQREPGDLWRWWSRNDPWHEHLPPDLDDTACALLALGGGSREHLASLERYRTAGGRFMTWTDPAAIAPVDRRAIDKRLDAGFGERAEGGNDIDCAVNLNVLRYAASVGVELPGVCRWLDGLLAAGRVPRCSAFYYEAAHIDYFATRAWMAGATCLERGLRAAAVPLLRSLREDAGRRGSSVAATSVFTLLRLGVDDPAIDAAVDALLAEQRDDGSWPATTTVPDQHGSAALDTGLVLEALAVYDKWLAAPARRPSRGR